MPPLDEKGKPIVFFESPPPEKPEEKKPEKDLEATYQEDLEKWIAIVAKLGIKRDEAIRSFKVDRDAKIAAQKKLREAGNG